MSFSLRVIKEVFLYTFRAGNNILLFLAEAVIFLVISLVIGFLISTFIFSLGTGSLVPIYKQVVSLGLVLAIISFFVYRSIKVFIEEWRVLSFFNLPINEKIVLCFIYFSSSLVPRWFGFISTLLFWVFIIFTILSILGFFIYLTLGFCISYFSLESEVLTYIYEVFFRFIFILKSFIFDLHDFNEGFSRVSGFSNIFWWTILAFLETIFIMTLFNGASTLKKAFQARESDGKINLSMVLLSPIIWYFLLVSFHLVFIYMLVYVFIIYKSILIIM